MNLHLKTFPGEKVRLLTQLSEKVCIRHLAPIAKFTNALFQPAMFVSLIRVIGLLFFFRLLHVFEEDYNR